MVTTVAMIGGMLQNSIMLSNRSHFVWRRPYLNARGIMLKEYAKRPFEALLLMIDTATILWPCCVCGKVSVQVGVSEGTNEQAM